MELTARSPVKRRVASLALLLASLFISSSLAAMQPAHGFVGAGQYAATVIGQPNFGVSTLAPTPNHLFYPFSVTFDRSGNLWVADENNARIVEFKPPFTDGESASLEMGQQNFDSDFPWGATQSTFEPVWMTFDSAGDLWVSDTYNNRILEFRPPFTSGLVNASLELGQPPGVLEFRNTTHSAGPAGLYYPTDMKFDSAGDLWISDRGNNRVLEFRPPFTSGMNASLVIGQPGLSTVPGIPHASQSTLWGPNGLAFDSSGNLWVADENFNRVLEFAASSLGTNDPPAVLEIGQPAGAAQFASVTNATASNRFAAPVGLAFDSAGDLWVSDRGNNRVLEFRPPFVDGMSASLVIGQVAGPIPFTGNATTNSSSTASPRTRTFAGPTQFTSNATSLTQYGLRNPLGIAFDQWGDLWLSDQLNNRVLEFSATALETTAVNVDVPTTTEATQINVNSSNGNSCYQMGEQDVCHLVSNWLSVGVRADLIGIATASKVNIYSSYQGSQEPAYAAASRQGPAAPPASLAFYGLAVEGMNNGTATVCINDQSQAGGGANSIGMAYFADGAWATPSSVSRSGPTVCGTIPLSALSPSGETPVIAVGQGVTSAPSYLGAGSLVYASVIMLTVLVGTVLAVRRRAERNALPEEEQEEEDEEDGGWSW